MIEFNHHHQPYIILPSTRASLPHLHPNHHSSLPCFPREERSKPQIQSIAPKQFRISKSYRPLHWGSNFINGNLTSSGRRTSEKIFMGGEAGAGNWHLRVAARGHEAKGCRAWGWEWLDGLREEEVELDAMIDSTLGVFFRGWKRAVGLLGKTRKEERKND